MQVIKAANKMGSETFRLLAKILVPIKNEFVKPTPLFY